MQLILVRHALPERIHASDTPQADRLGGPADPPLTELGERQAERLVEALGAEDVAGLYTSPLARARGTAAPLAAALGRDPEIVHDLREYDADAAHYVPVHEMARLDPAAWERMLAGLLPAHVDVPAFSARVDAAIEGVVAAHPGRADRRRRRARRRGEHLARAPARPRRGRSPSRSTTPASRASSPVGTGAASCGPSTRSPMWLTCSP